jgi:hypothetical protein
MKRHLCFIAALGMCFFASNTHAQQVKADTGGIAIAGSVASSTIIIGIPLEKVDELVREAKRPLEDLTVQQRENIALLKEKLDLNEHKVRATLGILGENNIPLERLIDKLIEIAENFKVLQERWPQTVVVRGVLSKTDPHVFTLNADARRAIERGDLAKADALLADVKRLEPSAKNAAEASARRGEIALTRLRYGEAATHFASAAAALPKTAYEDQRISYLKKEASALYKQGDELGDNDALLSAVNRYKLLETGNTTGNP